MMHNYNPYNNAYDVNALQNQIQQNLANLQRLQQMQGSYQNPYAPQTQVSKGSFIPVKDYQEVVNAPTDASGIPTLFMNESQGVFWIKRFVDGSNKIQAFSFSPINNYSNEPITDNVPNVSTSSNKEIENIQMRIVKLEETQEKIISLLEKGANKDD